MTKRPSIESKTSQLRATAALASAGALWGTAFLFGKIALREMSVSTNVALQFCFGSLVLMPVVLLRRQRKISRRDFWSIVAAAVIGVPVQFLIQFKGLALTTVSHASLMVSTLPLLLAFSAVLFPGEKLRFFEWGVLTFSTAGA